MNTHYHGTQDNLQRQWYGREDHTLPHTLPLIEDKSIVWMPW